MKSLFIFLSSLLILSTSQLTMASDGMLSVSSKHAVEETANRLETILKDKGFTIFNRIRHSENAQKKGIFIRGTQLIIFGNPAIGSQLMACNQSVAIDLPMKALIWQDQNERIYLSYNNPDWLAQRHKLEGCEAVIEKVRGALAKISTAATQ